MTFSQHSHQADCPLCRQPTASVLSTTLRRGTGVAFYCGSCGHGFLSENKAPNAKNYYAENYRQEYSHNAEAVATNAREIFDVYKNYQYDRLKAITPYLSAETRLLEVAASSGQFLVNIKDRLALVNAIELDTACCRFLSVELGIEADSEFLRDSRFADKRYDVVCAFQVLEHVEDPVMFLRDLKQSAEKGAMLFIEVPNLHDPLLSIWDVKAYQKFYFHSAHLHYFTEDSLRKTAQLAGFDSAQVEISFTQDYNLLNHLSWIMNNGPQATCNIGLSEIDLAGTDADMSAWLTAKMKTLNDEYVSRLIEKKATANMMMMIKNV
jgi:2-polyprenyl-3-methyl-5-hydroxy-6-metoxy-1,4-benzoquinol methylase